jgi:hypothetical protein
MNITFEVWEGQRRIASFESYLDAEAFIEMNEAQHPHRILSLYNTMTKMFTMRVRYGLVSP